jgi:hypothetical protein
MIPKSGYRFSGKIVLKQQAVIQPNAISLAGDAMLLRAPLRIVYWARCLDRGPRCEDGVPDGKAGMTFAPILFGKAEIEIGQRTANRDMANVECAGRKRIGLALKTGQHGRAARRRTL